MADIIKLIGHLAIAQSGSDAGKCIDNKQLDAAIESIGLQPVDRYGSIGYMVKDKQIKASITFILKHKPNNIMFFVEKDEERKAHYIVYFNIKAYGIKEQVSFHSFDDSLWAFVNEHRKTQWVGKTRAGKRKEVFTDTREALIRLIEASKG